MNLGNLPKRALNIINKSVDSDSYSIHINNQGRTSCHPKQYSWQPPGFRPYDRHKYNGSYVLPISSIRGIHKKTNKKLKEIKETKNRYYKCHSWVLKNKFNLPPEICKIINNSTLKQRSPHLPIGNCYYGIAQNMRGVYVPSGTSLSERRLVKALPRNRYTAVRLDKRTGLYKKVLPGLVYKKPSPGKSNVFFVSNTVLNRLPKNF